MIAMRRSVSLILLAALFQLGCNTPYSLGDSENPVFRQGAIADIACGPSAIFNWLSHGGDDLRGILATLSADRSPVQTVRHVIDTYGQRRSATNPSVTRYGQHKVATDLGEAGDCRSRRRRSPSGGPLVRDSRHS